MIMADFKIGDKVRFIRDSNAGGTRYGHKGFETTIKRIDAYNGLTVCGKGLPCGFDPPTYPDDLELVTEPIRFKVGDRVVHDRLGGGRVVYTDNSSVPYWVEFDEGSSGWCFDLSPENTKTERQSIVALIEHGKPRPNKNPYVHATTEAATSTTRCSGRA